MEPFNRNLNPHSAVLLVSSLGPICAGLNLGGLDKSCPVLDNQQQTETLHMCMCR
jgi:hypothetical protein